MTLNNLLVAGLLLTAGPAAAQSNRALAEAGQLPGLLDKLARQGEQPRPFVLANLLVVHTPDPPATALRKLAGVLRRAGMATDTLDPAAGRLLVSVPAAKPPRSVDFVYTAKAAPEGRGAVLRLAGQVVVGRLAFDDAQSSMSYSLRNTSRAQCFRRLDEAARTYPGGRVGYQYSARPGQ